MSRSNPKLPYSVGSPSMVFGEDLLENVQLLAGLVDHVAIVLFHTPTLHNIPGPKEVRILKNMGEQEDLSFSVHLPAFLEIASSDKKKREESVQLTKEICIKLAAIDPRHYVLHIPFSQPTLVPVPGLYFTRNDQQVWKDWTQRALEALSMLQEEIGQTNRLLVENINYSPRFLKSFWKRGLCELCLDVGHLMLGQEKVLEAITQYQDVTRMIHLHGVRGYEEHLSLSVLNKKRVSEWMRYLREISFEGTIVLEVFSPRDLEESIDILTETFHF
jgi:sugar phosphate isomerase/epimerase